MLAVVSIPLRRVNLTIRTVKEEEVPNLMRVMAVAKKILKTLNLVLTSINSNSKFWS